MRDFWLITRLELRRIFSSLKIGGKKKQAASLLPLLFVGLLFVALIVLYEGMFFLSAPSEAAYAVVGFFAIISVAISFLSTLGQARSTLFSAKDRDRLAALPLSSRAVIGAKLFTLYAYNLIFQIAILLPAAVFYCIRTGGLSFAGVRILLAIPFFPVLPTVIAALLGTATGFILGRMRGAKPLVNLLYLAFVVGIVLFSSFSSEEAVDFVGMYDGYSKPLFFVRWLVQGAVFGETFPFLLGILLPLALAILFSAAVGLCYNALCDADGSTRKKGRGKIAAARPKSVKKVLYVRELKRYFTDTVYFVNTAVGAVLTVVAAIALAFGAGQVILPLLQAYPFAYAFLPGLLFLTAGMGYTAACAISMEGKQIWILKSLPIDERDIFFAKTSVQRTLNLPAAAFASVLLAIALKMPLLYALFTPLLTLVTVSAYADLCLYVNLKHPKMDWTNAAQVVKQGWSVGLCMLLSFPLGVGIAALGGGACYLLGEWGGIPVLLLFVLAAFGMNRLLKKKGVRLWKAL